MQTSTMSSDCLLRYTTHLRAQGYAPATLRAKVDVVAMIAGSSNVEPAELTVEHVTVYLGSRPLEVWSRRKYLEHLRAFATWASIADPTAGIRTPHRPRGIPKPVGEQQLALLLAAAKPRTRGFLMLGAYAGLRSFEIAKVADADFEQTATGPALRVEGKGGRVDLLPVPEVLSQDMASWRAEAHHGRLWPEVTANAVQCAIRKLGREIDVPVSCHQLRHRYGTAIYAASRDLLLTQRLMRHASPTTTAGYVQAVDELGASVVDRLPIHLAA